MKYKCDFCGKPTDDISIIPMAHGKTLEYHTCDFCKDLHNRQYDWEQDNEHLYESNIVCPYCDYEFDDYDSYSYVEEGDCDVECPMCDKTFKVEIKQTVEFSTHKRAEDMPKDWGLDKSNE